MLGELIPTKTDCMKTRFSGLLLALILSSPVFAQKKGEKLDIKFGRVSAADFDLSKAAFDTGASAVVIADIGTSKFEGNSRGWFSLLFTRHQRIKVLNKNGVEAATYAIPLYSNGKEEEKLEKLKAYTYNLENGQLVETKMNSEEIFKEKYDKRHVIQKFTLPNVKVGSIIDVTYTIKSDFLFNLQPWEFQGTEYPRLWSEYSVELPDFFDYVMIKHGYVADYLKDQEHFNSNFSIREQSGGSYTQTDIYNISSNTTLTRWVQKNVPALKKEPYTSTIDNHLSKLEFQLAAYRFPNTPVKKIMGNWGQVSEELLKDEQFGAHLAKQNGWLDDEVKAVVGNSNQPIEKAHKLFEYVRDRFTCTDHTAAQMAATPRATLKEKKGNVADINLMLVAMLKHEGIEAAPVIVGLRNHGATNDLYPLMHQYNYVVCLAKIDGKSYYLDATHPQLGFGKLPAECYNGHARIINELPLPVFLEADSLRETKVTTLYISNNEKGVWEGSLNSRLGYYESMSMREYLKEKGTGALKTKIRSGLASEVELGEVAVDSLKQYDLPLTVRYDMKFEGLKGEDLIYFSPMLSEAYKENMFKAAERNYPVEMPYATAETYLANIEIPKGYVVDELPKSVRVKLEKDDGMFEYLTRVEDDIVQLRCVVQLNKAVFASEEYESLRNFFTYVVKKQSEQIVFKKKS